MHAAQVSGVVLTAYGVLVFDRVSGFDGLGVDLF